MVKIKEQDRRPRRVFKKGDLVTFNHRRPNLKGFKGLIIGVGEAPASTTFEILDTETGRITPHFHLPAHTVILSDNEDDLYRQARTYIRHGILGFEGGKNIEFIDPICLEYIDSRPNWLIPLTNEEKEGRRFQAIVDEL